MGKLMMLDYVVSTPDFNIIEMVIIKSRYSGGEGVFKIVGNLTNSIFELFTVNDIELTLFLQNTTSTLDSVILRLKLWYRA